jgi:hypothetical protein
MGQLRKRHFKNANGWLFVPFSRKMVAGENLMAWFYEIRCSGYGERFCYPFCGCGRWQKKSKKIESFRFVARRRSWDREDQTRFRSADSVKA